MVPRRVADEKMEIGGYKRRAGSLSSRIAPQTAIIYIKFNATT